MFLPLRCIYAVYLEGLVNKERELAGLQLEEKDREAQLWRTKYLQLQVILRSTNVMIGTWHIVYITLFVALHDCAGKIRGCLFSEKEPSVCRLHLILVGGCKTVQPV